MALSRRIFFPINEFMSFYTEYERYKEMVEEWIKNSCSGCGSEAPLKEAMAYSLMAGGKRLRPVLSLAVCDIFGGDRNMVMPFAGAIEFIHTYSLIHDDLPCMDNDDFRRGKLTNHKVFGEDMAVLSGDGLLNMAFEIMLMEAVKDTERAYLRSRASLIIAKAAGVEGMIGGQVIDMKSEGQTISYQRLCAMHEKKTGALIKASILAPAELLNVEDSIKSALASYAQNLGLAFQIKDDILDFEGNSEVVGKPTGSDDRNSKSTFVSVMGIEKAKELLGLSVEQAVEALKPLSNADFLVKAAAYIAERDK